MGLYEENPFCTRRIRPGAIPYYFPQGKSVETLVDKLEANGWDGQIVGPHGSGKSTLLAAMLPEIARRGKRLVHLELQDGVRELPLLMVTSSFPTGHGAASEIAADSRNSAR